MEYLIYISIRSYRQVVKSSPFHGGVTGSNPVGSTNFEKITCINILYNIHKNMNNCFQHISFIKSLVPASAGVAYVYWKCNENCDEYKYLGKCEI